MILYFFARFLRGISAVSPGYTARMIPILGSMVAAELDEQHQCLDRREPCRCIVLRFGSLAM